VLREFDGSLDLPLGFIARYLYFKLRLLTNLLLALYLELKLPPLQRATVKVNDKKLFKGEGIGTQQMVISRLTHLMRKFL
jgi:hypothetical protein